MNSTVVSAVFALSIGLSCSGFAADDISPCMSDSPKAQRDRELTLLGRMTAASPEELARTKERLMRVLRNAQDAGLAAIDAQMREAHDDEEQLRRLRVKRDALLKRGKEFEDKIERITAGTPNP